MKSEKCKIQLSKTHQVHSNPGSKLAEHTIYRSHSKHNYPAEQLPVIHLLSHPNNKKSLLLFQNWSQQEASGSK